MSELTLIEMLEAEGPVMIFIKLVALLFLANLMTHWFWPKKKEEE